MDFRVPDTLPQDLLLIRDLVEPAEPVKAQNVMQDKSDDISSSSSETDSEEEVVKDLIVDRDDDDVDDGKSLPDTTSSSSSDSETDFGEDEAKQDASVKKVTPPVEFDDDDEPITNAGSRPQTKNEIVDADINIPDLEEVGTEEDLERVGEILSIIDNVVIVKGLPSEVANRGSERALDSDTLLVFGDRKVMGYIYETFGPTSQPLYQVKFNSNYPLNPEKVAVGREVFHAPRRSHFVFISQLKHLKGSDASNVHDEEPAEDEQEFSDDEAEAAYRSRLKRKRAESRARSVSSSRPSTPAPSQMRDQDMMHETFLNNSAFDEHGPYDSDYGAGTSRPPPKPYDDPYSDAYNMIKPESEVLASATSLSRTDHPKPPVSRGRGHYRSGDRRGRGRGRRSSSGVHPPILRESGYARSTNDSVADRAFPETYDPHTPHSPSFAQYHQDHPFNFAPTSPIMDPRNAWDQLNPQYGHFTSQQAFAPPAPPYQTPYGGSSMFIQPHINPRFASAFGMTFAPNSPSSPSGYGTPQGAEGVSLQSHDWTAQWTVPVADSTPPEQQNNHANDKT